MVTEQKLGTLGDVFPERTKTDTQKKDSTVSRLLSEYAPEGTRNDRAASIAGTFHGWGVPDDVVLELLALWSNAHCDPPLPLRELQGVARSVARYPQKLTSFERKPFQTSEK